MPFFFDEAIFLVKPSGGRSSDELLREACAIASRKAEHRLRRRSGRVLWFLLGVALGGALAGGVWMILALTK